MPWAKELMPELFEGLEIVKNGEDVIKITKVETLSGECHINTRKGKIFHFFEFEIKLKWSGTPIPSSSRAINC
jgi:activator of HSP90 ATPase